LHEVFGQRFAPLHKTRHPDLIHRENVNPTTAAPQRAGDQFLALIGGKLGKGQVNRNDLNPAGVGLIETPDNFQMRLRHVIGEIQAGD